jgi:hypothetical protein
MREFKVVILGSGGVGESFKSVHWSIEFLGKSALTVQFVSNKFLDYFCPTIEDFYRKEIEVMRSIESNNKNLFSGRWETMHFGVVGHCGDRTICVHAGL